MGSVIAKEIFPVHWRLTMIRLFRTCFRSCCLAAILCCSAVMPAAAADAPIQIEADRMSSTEKTNSVLFSGNVDARQADVRIRANEMTVFYTPAKPNKKGQKTASQQVEKIICTGNVEVSKKEWLGTSKKMLYLAKERQVILMDNAKAYQGQNMVSGEKIIYYMDEGRSEVVGGSKGTRTTVGDSGEGAKKPGRVNMTIIQK